MKFKFILNESKDIPDWIKEKFNFATFEPDKEITEKWKYKPDWAPTHLTHKFLYNIWRKYKIKLTPDKELDISHERMILQFDQDDQLVRIFSPYFSITYQKTGLVGMIAFYKYRLGIYYTYDKFGVLKEIEFAENFRTVHKERF